MAKHQQNITGTAGEDFPLPLTRGTPGERTVQMVSEQTKKLKEGIQRIIKNIILKTALIVIFILALFIILFGIIISPDTSMEPSVKSGDVVMFYRLDKSFVLHDLAVISYEGKKQIRRVVAKGGDTIDIIDGRLVVNGSHQQEKNIVTTTERYDTGIEFPLTVPDKHIFVLSDDRDFATDSRMYGVVASDDTYGKVITLLRIRGI